MSVHECHNNILRFNSQSLLQNGNGTLIKYSLIWDNKGFWIEFKIDLLIDSSGTAQ